VLGCVGLPVPDDVDDPVEVARIRDRHPRRIVLSMVDSERLAGVVDKPLDAVAALSLVGNPIGVLTLMAT